VTHVLPYICDQRLPLVMDSSEIALKPTSLHAGLQMISLGTYACTDFKLHSTESMNFSIL